MTDHTSSSVGAADAMDSADSTAASEICVSTGPLDAPGSLRRVRVPVEGLAQGIAEHLNRLPPGIREQHWTLATFRGNYRKQDNWEGACGVTLDFDYHDGAGTHSPLPDEVRDRLMVAVEDGSLAGNLFYLTPRGCRVAVLFPNPVTSREGRTILAAGAAVVVTESLGKLGLCSTGTGGLREDSGKTLDCSAVMLCPRAKCDGVVRDAHVYVLRDEPYDFGQLRDPAERRSDSNGSESRSSRSTATDVEAAVARYNQQHRRELPRSGGPCPACGHKECFGTLPEADTRWVCFSQNHAADSGGCGRPNAVGTCWTGDFLDLDAHQAARGRFEHLRATGYLGDAPRAASSRTEPTAWEEPIPFRDADRPEFPTKHLPRVLGAFVDGTATAIQVARDVPALASLGVISAAIGGKIAVRLRSDRIEPVNLWTATVLGSGERKSAVFAVVSRGLEAWEATRAEALAPEVERDRQHLATIEAQLASAVKDAARAGPGERVAADAARDALAAERAAFRCAQPFQLILGDVTQEAVAITLADQAGRAAIVVDEAATLFDIIRGRYAKDDRPNLDVYLQSYSGSPIRVNRAGRGRIRVPRPCLTIATTMQPTVLESVGREREMTERGLLPRFLWGLPSSMVGFRDVDAAPLRPEVVENYDRIIQVLCDLPETVDDEGHLVAHVVNVEPAGVVLLRELAAEVEHDLRPGGRFEHVREWANRIEGNTARVALALHLFAEATRHVEGFLRLSFPVEPVSARAVEDAVTLAREYFIPHGLAAFARMGADRAVGGAQRLLHWIRRKQLMTFTRTEAHRGNDSWAPRVDDLAEPLRVLEEHLFVRVLPPEESKPGKPGRPASTRWEVNPATHMSQGGNR